MTDDDLIIREAEEDLRQEQLQKLWQEYGNFIIAAVVSIILATGGWSGYKHWNTSQKIASTNTALELLDDETFPENITAQTQLDMRPGLKAIVLLNAAGTYLAEDQTDKATEIYNALVEDSSIPTDFRDLAVITLARLGQTTDPEQLKGIANNDRSAYQSLARLELAVALAQDNRFEEAITHLDKIKETPNLPESVYIKAQSLAHVYALKKGENS